MNFRAPTNTCKIPRGTGLTAYQQAVRDGFKGSEKEWIEYLVILFSNENMREIIREIVQESMFGVRMFGSIEEGLENTSEGDYFTVPALENTSYVHLFQHQINEFTQIEEAVLISIYPSKQALEEALQLMAEQLGLAQQAVSDAQHQVTLAEEEVSKAAQEVVAAVQIKNQTIAVKEQTEQIKEDTNQIKTETQQIKTETDQIKTETSQIKSDTQLIKEATQVIYDNFDARFLGAFAADPVTDNKGSPLTTGALYFNTTIERMFVWTGTLWQTTQDRPRIVPQTITENTTITGFQTDQNYYSVVSSEDVDITIDSSASINIEGTVVYFARRGSGEVRLLAGSGVTFNNAATNLLRAQHSIVMLVYIGNNTWDIAGDLVSLD